MTRAPAPPDVADAPPPRSSWRSLYALVIGELALLVLLFHALTRWAT